MPFCAVLNLRNKHDPGASASLDSIVGDVQEGNYGPWLVVSHRRSGHKKPEYVGGQGETILTDLHVTCHLDGPWVIKGLQMKTHCGPQPPRAQLVQTLS